MRARDRPSCRLLRGIPGDFRGRRRAIRLDFTATQPSRLEQLAARLLARALRTFPEPHFDRPLKRATRDALMLAERTGYALLLLPELFAELAITEMIQAEI